MNIEHLCRTVKKNYHLLKDEKKALTYIRYQFELLAWKRQKLKLGAIVFEIKEIVIAEITLWQDVEIRYIRQDTTQDDELKIENRLKALNWQWDFKNVGAFVIVFSAACLFLYACAVVWYQNAFPELAAEDKKLPGLLRFLFSLTFTSVGVGQFKSGLMFNFWLVDVLTDFCVFYSVIA